jgi:hypothetical protein
VNRWPTWVASLLVIASAAHADPFEERQTPFDQGRFGVSAGAGVSYSNGYRYYSIGIGAGYYLLDGFAVGVSLSHQWGDGPGITQITPGLIYVAQPLYGSWPVLPYIGIHYTHGFVDGDYYDIDAVGASTGIMYVVGRVVFGIGVGYTRTVSECIRCDAVYPDLTLSVTF